MRSSSVTKSTMIGTRLAASPALRVTLASTSGVIASASRSVSPAFSTADSSLRSASVTSTGNRISLFFTELSLSITTRMKLPASARIRSNRLTVTLAGPLATA